MDLNYMKVYLIILNLITQFLLPIVSLTLLNISVYREVTIIKLYIWCWCFG